MTNWIGIRNFIIMGVAMPVAIASLASPANEKKLVKFLDQSKSIPPQIEWNREVISRKGGGVLTYRVTSQEPFAVTIIAGRTYQAMLRHDEKGMHREDVLTTLDVKGVTYTGQVKLPSGSSWFILSNQSGKTVKMHLECFGTN